MEACYIQFSSPSCGHRPASWRQWINYKLTAPLIFSQEEIPTSSSCQTWACHFLNLFRFSFFHDTGEERGINKFMKWCRTVSHSPPLSLSLPCYFVRCSVGALVLSSRDEFLPAGSLQRRFVETRKLLWLKWLEMETGRWAIDSLGDYFRMCLFSWEYF